MERGKFIVFEGIDGAGKSTQSQLLYRFLKEKRIKVFLTAEPTRGPVGQLIRFFLKKKKRVNRLALQLLFTADRADHLEKVILPLLKKGFWVISDRYFFSTISYGLLEIKDFSWLHQLNKKFPLPDLTFFIDLPEKEALKRIKKERKNLSLFEKEKFLKKTRRNYLYLKKRFERIFIINGQQSIPEVFDEIKKIIFQKVKKIF
ncbi:MAG: dTMP kinase [Minisyncoccales bacterium]